MQATGTDRKPPRDPRLRPGREERPKAPWHPVPLVEIATLAGLIALVLGLINHSRDNGPLFIALGLGLCSLAGLDTVAREHFAGYRSHTSILAGFCAIFAGGITYFAGLPPIVTLGMIVLVGALAFFIFREAFARKTGVGWR